MRKKKPVVNWCILTAHIHSMYIGFFICLHSGVEGLHIYSIFCEASEGSSWNMTMTVAYAFTIGFADFLNKPIVLAGGHAHT